MRNPVHFYSVAHQGLALDIITLPKGGKGVEGPCAYGTKERMVQLTRREIAEAFRSWRKDGIKIVRD